MGGASHLWEEHNIVYFPAVSEFFIVTLIAHEPYSFRILLTWQRRQTAPHLSLRRRFWLQKSIGSSVVTILGDAHSWYDFYKKILYSNAGPHREFLLCLVA